MLEKMKLWWKFEGRHYHKDFIQGVKNLYKWFPTIWNDRDWDGHYIYEILRVKLENQAYCIGNESRHVNSKRDVERMLLCSRLIQIQQEDLYEIEYLDYIKEDHHMIPTDETHQWYTIESTTIEDNLDEYFKKYPRQYKQVQLGKINYFDIPGTPPEKKSRKTIAIEIAYHNQDKSRKLLYKIMERHIDGWWN